MKAIGKYLLKPLILFLLAYHCSMLVYGQVKAVASANKQIVAQNDLLTVNFSIENTDDVQQFTPPSFNGCKIVQGPTHVNSSSVINGIKSSAYSFVYVVQPLSAGKYCFSGASAKVNGKRVAFNTLNIEVKKGSGKSRYEYFEESDDNSTRELYSDYILRRGENVQDKIRKNLFIKVDVDKTTCYEGESIVATYKLYTRLRSESKVIRRPSFNGFSVYDMVDPSAVPSSIEKLNGKDFNVYLIRKVQLFPLQSGKLELDAAEVENSITFLKAEEAVKNGGEGLSALLRAFEMDDVKNRGLETEQVSIRSNPVAVNVKALPEDKPASFNGAVGSFSIQSAVSKNEVPLNDAAVLKVIIKGEGNFGVLNTPDVHWPKNVEGYEPNTKEDFLKNVVPMRGYKSYEYSFTPREKGDITLAPVEFSFFDPVAKLYRTITTDPIKISATPAVAQNASLKINSIAGDYINEPVILSRPLILTIASLLLLGFGFFLYRYIKLSGNDATGAGNEAAVVPSKETIKELKAEEPVIINPLFNARLMLVQQDSKGFYGELKRNLREYVSQKFNCSPNLNIRDIEQKMRGREVDDDVISQFSLVIQQCEIALYNPYLNEADMQSVYDLASDFVDNISRKDQFG